MRRDRERFGEVICEARERIKVKAWSMSAKSESSSLEGGQRKEAKWLRSNHYTILVYINIYIVAIVIIMPNITIHRI